MAYGATWEQRLEHLGVMLFRIQAAGLAINGRTPSPAEPQVQYLTYADKDLETVLARPVLSAASYGPVKEECLGIKWALHSL